MSRATMPTTRSPRPNEIVPLPPDPVIEAYKEHVDRSLIREQLRRTPDERVQRMIGALRLAEELGRAGRQPPE